MGVDMLLVDGKFVRCNTEQPNFFFTDAHVVIDSLIKPVYFEITEASSPIPTEIYRFSNYDHLMALANTNTVRIL
ncbi:hypothetical protein YC2023_091374 [Brassica napus]